MAAEYKLPTLASVVLIPEEARGRFLAELPYMLAELQDRFDNAERYLPVLRVNLPWYLRWLSDKAVLDIYRKSLLRVAPIWVDDDKRTSTFTMRAGKGDPPLVTETSTY